MSWLAWLLLALVVLVAIAVARTLRRNRRTARVATSLGVLAVDGRRGTTDTAWAVELCFDREQIAFTRPDGAQATATATLWVDFRDRVAEVDLDESVQWGVNGTGQPLTLTERENCAALAQAMLGVWELHVMKL